MDDILQKYKDRINVLKISEEDKDKLYDNFYSEIQYKLVKALYDSLTKEQRKMIDEAKSDEEVIKIYFSLLNESIEIPEFLQYIEQTYTDAMTKALSELPNL